MAGGFILQTRLRNHVKAQSHATTCEQRVESLHGRLSGSALVGRHRLPRQAGSMSNLGLREACLHSRFEEQPGGICGRVEDF